MEKEKKNEFVVYQSGALVQLVRVVDGQDHPQRCARSSPVALPVRDNSLSNQVTVHPVPSACDNTCPFFSVHDGYVSLGCMYNGKTLELLEDDETDIDTEDTAIILPKK